jgi:nicotinamide-nucleotide amidase
VDTTDIALLATRLGQSLLSRHWVITTAESCTGGGIAQAITAVEGSSQWFEQGFITYSNSSKCQQLQVDLNTLEQYGAVSQPVVVAMAAGALLRASADMAIAVSGIAGPGGGSVDKPVGTVWLGWALQGCEPQSCCYHFTGDRHSVRQQAIAEALRGANSLLKNNTV